NERLLKQVPLLPYQELAVVYYYQADKDASGGWCILLKNEQLITWGISQEQLHMVAVENTSKKSFQIVPLSQMLWQLIGFAKPLEDEDQDVYDEMLEAESSMYILTNEEMCFGAVGIYFEDTLRKVSSLIGGDFYVLPSSLHECMILPVKNSGYMQAEQLQWIVREVNQKTVGNDDLLGDSVYRYDAQKRETDDCCLDRL
ncbi:MAG: DUF5688 family protein, partial [Lachnospiraceae bacterium]|nr:DUF5688 family protein [Lachnospiraceae bacterium]